MFHTRIRAGAIAGIVLSGLGLAEGIVLATWILLRQR